MSPCIRAAATLGDDSSGRTQQIADVRAGVAAVNGTVEGASDRVAEAMHDIERVSSGAVLACAGLLLCMLFGVLDANRAEAQDSPQTFTPDPAEACEGKEPGASCWMEITDRPGCYLWNPKLAAGETVTWSGECSGGLAQGTGSRQWSHPDDEGNPLVSGGEGELRGGKPHGPWSHYSRDGGLSEGSYADGEKRGEWMEVYPDGTVFQGEYAEGQRRGRWASTKRGDAGGGFYVAGKRHGQWKEFGVANDDETVGWVREGLYVTGRRDGRWVVRFDGGTVREFTYRTGVLHGESSSRFASGSMQEGPYADGKKHGEWSYTRPNGNRLRSGEYVDGEREGAWREYGEDDELREHGEYKKGKKHGDWTRLVRGEQGQLYGQDVSRWTDGSEEPMPDEQCPYFLESSDLPCWYPLGPRARALRCFVWLEPGGSGFPHTDHAHVEVSWRGDCKHGKADSPGVLEGYGTRHSGQFREGKRTGGWLEGENQGPYLDNKRHGKWVLKHDGGRREEGTYKHGRKDGLWSTSENGTNAQRAMFVNGKRSGEWKRIGRWVIRKGPGGNRAIPPGTIMESGRYDAAGHKTGEWVERQGSNVRSDACCEVGRGAYIEGKREGRWEWTDLGGHSLVMHFRDGLAHGPRVFVGSSLGGLAGYEEVRYFIAGEEVNRRQWNRWVKADNR